MNTYKYVGTIGSSQYSGNPSGTYKCGEIRVYNFENSSIPPVKLKVSGQMWDYIDSIVWSDDEERYLEKEFYYDELFNLLAIVIPGADRYPAKVIISDGADEYQRMFKEDEARIYGPAGLMDDRYPESMSKDEYRRLRDDVNKLWDLNRRAFEYPTDYYQTVRDQQKELQRQAKRIAELEDALQNIAIMAQDAECPFRKHNAE